MRVDRLGRQARSLSVHEKTRDRHAFVAGKADRRPIEVPPKNAPRVASGPLDGRRGKYVRTKRANRSSRVATPNNPLSVAGRMRGRPTDPTLSRKVTLTTPSAWPARNSTGSRNDHPIVKPPKRVYNTLVSLAPAIGDSVEGARPLPSIAMGGRKPPVAKGLLIRYCRRASSSKRPATVCRPPGNKPPPAALRIALRVRRAAPPERPPRRLARDPRLRTSEVVGARAFEPRGARPGRVPSRSSFARPHRPGRWSVAPGSPSPFLRGGRIEPPRVPGSYHRPRVAPFKAAMRSGSRPASHGNTPDSNIKESFRLFIPLRQLYHCRGPRVRVNGLCRFPPRVQGGYRCSSLGQAALRGTKNQNSDGAPSVVRPVVVTAFPRGTANDDGDRRGCAHPNPWQARRQVA